MPYYCTVPRCTSMAGKVKNVSFHQFPKDEELAKLWNDVLKRGKPYTKYSKVCSLHFKPEDYTITGLGRNKGLWRTLRKDAVPSQNLPSDSPVPCQRTKNTGSEEIKYVPDVMDAQLQQVAHVIYAQAMLAIQVKAADCSATTIYPEMEQSSIPDSSQSSNSSGQFNETLSQIEQLFHKNNISTKLNTESATKFCNNEVLNTNDSNIKAKMEGFGLKHTHKCNECSKCFKDPDVFILHKRTHMSKNPIANANTSQRTLSEKECSEKENVNNNAGNHCVIVNSTDETLRANPILANLLKSNIPHALHRGEEMHGILNYENVTSIENQIMSVFATNMKNYFRNLSSLMTQKAMDIGHHSNSVSNIEYTGTMEHTHDLKEDILTENTGHKLPLDIKESMDTNCDSKDLGELIESSSFMTDEDSQNCDLTVST